MWQYKTIYTGALDAKELEKYLNQLGEDGWELVAIESRIGVLKKAKQG